MDHFYLKITLLTLGAVGICVILHQSFRSYNRQIKDIQAASRRADLYYSLSRENRLREWASADEVSKT